MKKIINVSKYEAELYNIVNKVKILNVTIDDDDYKFYIQDNKLYYED